MKYFIYKITNLINGKFYIGVHKTINWDDGYMGSGFYIQRAIKKYGVENFKKEVLCSCNSEKEMYNLEKLIVNEKLVRSKKCYNLKMGGRGGWPLKGSKLSLKVGKKIKLWWDSLTEKEKEIQKKKVSDSTKIIMNTDKIREKVKNGLNNRSFNEKQKQYKNISKGIKKWWQSLSKEEKDERNNKKKEVMSNPAIRKKLSIAQSKIAKKGENNQYFKKVTKPFYDNLIKNNIIDDICDDNFFDSDIVKKHGGHFKIIKFIDYLNKHNYIIIKERKLKKFNGKARIKTFCVKGENNE